MRSRCVLLLDQSTCFSVANKTRLLSRPQPKWGFLPSADHLSSDTKDIKTQYCRFCMHTFLKTSPKIGVEAALEHHARGYCPLDLYSGDAERISRAIDGLWRGWIKSGGTANNLRFFIDGKRLAPTNVSTRCFVTVMQRPL